MSALDTQPGGDHYRNKAIQPVEYIVANNLGFLEGCIVKRITRYNEKGGDEDLRKIQHECELLIELRARQAKVPANLPPGRDEVRNIGIDEVVEWLHKRGKVNPTPTPLWPGLGE